MISGQSNMMHTGRVASKVPRARVGRASHRVRARGFTLIELMIVVAVVAILAAIAIPSYADSVRKGRRGQVKADLVESAQILERYRTINGTYAGVDPAKIGVAASSPRTGTFYYTITLSGNTAKDFLLTAAPLATGGQNKDSCGTLTVNAQNVQTHSAGTNAQCSFGTLPGG